MRPHKIGVLGCGMIAELGHLPVLRHVPGLVLDAVYDINFDRALQMQRRFHIPHAYPSEREFWASDLDAVVVCTPAPLHHANVMTAASHGKHVLCEKPLALTEPEIEAMDEVMASAGLQLFTGFTYRFSPSAMDIRRLVREGAIGEVRLLRLVYNWNLHGKWRWNEHGQKVPSPLRVGRMEEGGPLVDCGVHQIDLARWWLDSEVEWQRGLGVWIDDYRAPDHMYLHMGHANGAHTMIEVSFSYNATAREPRSHFQYELIGTDGVIRYNREEHNFEIRNSHGTQWLPWHGEKNFAGMHAELARALTHGTPGDMPTARDGLLATRIARLATEQAIRDREAPSQAHPSTLCRAKDVHLQPAEAPLDLLELPELLEALPEPELVDPAPSPRLEEPLPSA